MPTCTRCRRDNCPTTYEPADSHTIFAGRGAAEATIDCLRAQLEAMRKGADVLAAHLATCAAEMGLMLDALRLYGDRSEHAIAHIRGVIAEAREEVATHAANR